MKSKKNFFGTIFSSVTFISALPVLVVSIGIFITLIYESRQAISEFGFFGFLFSFEWNYADNIYGAAQPLLGTLITSLGALIIAVPIAIGIAIFITELCPHFLKGAVSSAIELLAAIPSIIYGMWGLFTFAPFIEGTVQKWIIASVGNVPIVGQFFQAQYAGGVSIFTASLVLSIMVIPFIASIARDTFVQTPDILKESAYAIGATKWEVISNVVMPYCKTGIASGIIIATGRALGETMAIAYVIGNSHGKLGSIFDPYATITSTLANEFNEASGLHMSSLFMLAFILFIANFATLALAKIYTRKEIK